MFRLTIAFMRPLPLPVAYAIAASVADALYPLFRRHRRALNENLARVLDTRDRRLVNLVARRAFRNFGRFVIDFIHFPTLTKDEVRRRLTFDNWSDIDRLYDQGKGVVVVTLHYGIWDLGAAALATRHYAVNAVGDVFPYQRLTDLVFLSRERLGMKVVPTNGVGPGLIRALRRGEMIALLIDVDAPGQSVTVDFFGAPTEVSAGPARLALRTGARVMPSVVLRGEDDPTRIVPVVDGSIDFTPTGDEERDVRDLTQVIMRSLEREVRKRPDQWYIFRRMWASSYFDDGPPAGPQERAS